MHALVSPESLLQLGFSFWGAKALLSAVELDVFSTLATGSLNVDALAQRLGLHERGARDFFDALVALRLLERHHGRYANSAAAELYLDRHKSGYVGAVLELANRRTYGEWGSLTQALRTGHAADQHPDTAFDNDYQRSRLGVSKGVAQIVARKFPWGDYQTLLDLGTGKGTLPVYVLHEHAHLQGIGFDLPGAQPLFERFVAERGLTQRLRFQCGDFMIDSLPQTHVIVMGNVLNDWNLLQKRRLLARAYGTLPPEGAAIVYEPLIDDARRENAMALLGSLHLLLETAGGFEFTGADCAAWMREVGFRDIRVEHLLGTESMIVGVK
jgi:O-methyltransferase domain/Dimerisation domain